jgi:hypothetical protein
MVLINSQPLSNQRQLFSGFCDLCKLGFNLAPRPGVSLSGKGDDFGDRVFLGDGRFSKGLQIKGRLRRADSSNGLAYIEVQNVVSGENAKLFGYCLSVFHTQAESVSICSTSASVAPETAWSTVRSVY